MIPASSPPWALFSKKQSQTLASRKLINTGNRKESKTDKTVSPRQKYLTRCQKKNLKMSRTWKIEKMSSPMTMSQRKKRVKMSCIVLLLFPVKAPTTTRAIRSLQNLKIMMLIWANYAQLSEFASILNLNSAPIYSSKCIPLSRNSEMTFYSWTRSKT